MNKTLENIKEKVNTFKDKINEKVKNALNSNSPKKTEVEAPKTPQEQNKKIYLFFSFLILVFFVLTLVFGILYILKTKEINKSNNYLKTEIKKLKLELKDNKKNYKNALKLIRKATIIHDREQKDQIATLTTENEQLKKDIEREISTNNNLSAAKIAAEQQRNDAQIEQERAEAALDTAEADLQTEKDLHIASKNFWGKEIAKNKKTDELKKWTFDAECKDKTDLACNPINRMASDGPTLYDYFFRWNQATRNQYDKPTKLYKKS